MEKTGKTESVMREKNYLLQLKEHPFVITLHQTFMDEDNLYFVFENCGYGDLSKMIKQKKYLDYQLAVHYSAEIVCALEEMHVRKKIVHRDLKPENIMINDDLHLRLIDFGDAKEVEENFEELADKYMYRKLHPEEAEIPEDFTGEETGPDSRGTFCGTALYVSPEMLEDSLALPSSDLWALGCIIYRMHTGQLPFEGPTEIATFDKILSREIIWPADLNPDARDIIDKLLQVDPRKRLGCAPLGKKNDFSALKGHVYFREIDFEQLHLCPPPVKLMKLDKNQ